MNVTAGAQQATGEAAGVLPLAGLSVLLTRPAGRADTQAAAIQSLGGRVTQLPLLAIEPITERAAVERLKTFIMALDNYDAAIFISTNAATLGLEWIENYWPQLPVGLEAYAVGPGTAEILRQLPWPVHCSDVGVTSEHLLALPGLQNVAGKRIALFRGQGGRELLAETLRERGARVDYLEIYQRRVPEYSRADVLKLIGDNAINAALATSQQILDSLIALLCVEGHLPQTLQDIRIVVPSQRVREHALAAGFRHVIDARGADDKAVLTSLQECQAASVDRKEAK
ncbi:MAG: uroporphyrinogen-III synthase [Gammaproteobacteria bacterium]|nr:uroporphyrinogen-III synthase [Gammaproteobacteria bacterium]